MWRVVGEGGKRESRGSGHDDVAKNVDTTRPPRNECAWVVYCEIKSCSRCGIYRAIMSDIIRHGNV